MVWCNRWEARAVMEASPRSGSDYFNYKKTFSLVLMPVCNADYVFTLVDIGDSGVLSDCEDFAISDLGFSIKNDLLNVPPPRNLPGSEKKLPYVFVGDDAFPSKPNIMKPFPGPTLTRSQRIFNHRPSRTRRVIENNFMTHSHPLLIQRFGIDQSDARKLSELGYPTS